MTEPEHARLRALSAAAAPAGSLDASCDPVMLNSGADFAKSGAANANLAWGAECGVDAMAPSPAGFHDVGGNLWQASGGGLWALLAGLLLHLGAC